MSGYDWTLSLGEYLIAALLLLVALAAAGLIGRAARAWLLPGWSGPPGLLADALLSVATLVLVAELLGLFGLFERGIYVVALIVLAAATRFGARDRDQASPAGGGPGPAYRSWAVAAGLVAAVVIARALWVTVSAYDGGMSGFDTHWYHGPFTALFLQSGDTFALNNSIAPQYLSWFYPHTSELLHAIVALPFDRDLLSPALNLVWLLGSMLAAWCIGRPYRVAPLSLLAASVILGSGLLYDQAGEMRNDIPAVFFVLAAAAIAVNAYARGTIAERGALVAIGLAAGLAAGTKLNYLATAGAMILALAVVVLPSGRRLRGFGLLFAAAFVTGGYWYLRNLVHSGNPLPWITSLGPIDLPGPSQEIGGREPHGVLEYLLNGEVWRDWLLPGLRESLTLLWPLILLATTIATLALLLPALTGGMRRAATAEAESEGGVHVPVRLGLALGLTILATVAAWLVAPASAEGPAGEPVGFVSGLRYLAPALTLAMALLPVALLGSSATIGRGDGVATSRRGAWVTVSLLAVATLLVGGYFLQRSYLESRYAEPDFATPGLNQAFAEASRSAPADADAAPVAVTSTRIYAFYGPDLQQPVAFVGIPEPQGGFRRPEGCAEWRQAVNASGAKRLIVAWDRLALDQAPLPPEAAWIAADPAATQLQVGGGAIVFRLEGKLDPATCR